MFVMDSWCLVSTTDGLVCLQWRMCCSWTRRPALATPTPTPPTTCTLLVTTRQVNYMAGVDICLVLYCICSFFFHQTVYNTFSMSFITYGSFKVTASGKLFLLVVLVNNRHCKYFLGFLKLAGSGSFSPFSNFPPKLNFYIFTHNYIYIHIILILKTIQN